MRNRRFVETIIEELLRNKCEQETQHIPYCCNPLTVAEGNKLRLVLDLRRVNKYVKQQKFKYENLATVAEMLEQGFYFGTFDLKIGYHNIPIAKFTKRRWFPHKKDSFKFF